VINFTRPLYEHVQKPWYCTVIMTNIIIIDIANNYTVYFRAQYIDQLKKKFVLFQGKPAGKIYTTVHTANYNL